ncbi:MAG: hypothetical protein IJW24_02990 [Clostridia bacterium]|nr:hypothetical protein [Clostridia bacterium]
MPTTEYVVNVIEERNKDTLAQIDVSSGAWASVGEDGSLSIDGTVIPVPEHEEGESFAGWHVGADPGTWIDYGGDIYIAEVMVIYACFEDYYDITVRYVYSGYEDEELAETQYIRHIKGSYTIGIDDYWPDYNLSSTEILINGEGTGVYIPYQASGYNFYEINIPTDGQTITVSGHYEVVVEYYSS